MQLNGTSVPGILAQVAALIVVVTALVTIFHHKPDDATPSKTELLGVVDPTPAGQARAKLKVFTKTTHSP